MIIKEIGREDFKQASVVSAVAFEFSLDLNDFDIDKKLDEVGMRASNGHKVKSIGAYSDDGITLYSNLLSIPFLVNFDGNKLMMSGIGNVATLPPYRRNGCIRESFKYLFPKLKEDDFPISYLFPFSCSYYRKFGYEVNSAINIWTIDFKAFKNSGVEGSIEMLAPEDSYDVVDEIYKKMYTNYNLTSVRDEAHYRYYNNRETYKNKKYAYVWRNKDGVAKGFMMFKKNNVDGKSIMDCTHFFGTDNDFMFTDTEGFLGLMDFALTFSSNYDSIKFFVPSNINIDGLINEANFTHCQRKASGMVRVIDAQKILQLSNYKGSGELDIKITDKYCDWNNTIFKVIFKNGKCESVVKTTGSYDIGMDISTFSSLICGCYHNAKDCLKLDLEIISNQENIDKVFYFKPNAVLDLF